MSCLEKERHGFRLTGFDSWDGLPAAEDDCRYLSRKTPMPNPPISSIQMSNNGQGSDHATPAQPTLRRPATAPLGDFTADRRGLLLMLMALVVGGAGGLLSWLLTRPIGIFTHIAFFYPPHTTLPH